MSIEALLALIASGGLLIKEIRIYFQNKKKPNGDDASPS